MPNIIDIIAQAQAPAQQRVNQFTARLDDHLASLPDDDARAEFCQRQVERWIALYEQWAQAVDSGLLKVKPGDPTAWDYNLTIAAISGRKARYSKVAA